MKEKYKYAIVCEILATLILLLSYISYITFEPFDVYADYLLGIGIVWFGLLTIFGAVPCAYFGFGEGEKE